MIKNTFIERYNDTSVIRGKRASLPLYREPQLIDDKLLKEVLVPFKMPVCKFNKENNNGIKRS